MHTILSKRHSDADSGFTLIEVMIVMAIIAILAAIAIPSYADYVLRGKLVDAPNNLSAARASVEQYYQDNRTYVGAPCTATLTNFAMTCVTTAISYTITATGLATSVTNGFIYSVDNFNNMKSTVGAVWGGGSNLCWIMKKGATC